MKKDRIKEALKLNNQEFKRLIGVTKETFVAMVEVLEEAYFIKHKKGGRKPTLTIEQQLTMALEYWRQYPTFFELGFDYGLVQSSAHDIVTWVEDVLINSGKFSLPGKKALLDNENIHEIVLVDVTETPIQRPKKNKNNGIPEKRKNIQ